MTYRSEKGGSLERYLRARHRLIERHEAAMRELAHRADVDVPPQRRKKRGENDAVLDNAA